MRDGLTQRFVSRAPPGKHYDGFLGLFLRVSPTGRRYFEQRITIQGRRCELGIGAYPVVDLARARDLALENARGVRHGLDPRRSRAREVVPVPTFSEATRAVIDLARPGWRNPLTAQKWLNTFEKYLFPRLGDRLVSDITTADLADILAPLYPTSFFTARTMRSRVRRVYRWAQAQSFCDTDPAGPPLDSLLPIVDHQPKRRLALPPESVADAIRRVYLTNSHDHAKWLFHFLVLTAVRSEEAREALWSEFDLDAALWRIPGDRMKMGNPHDVPLSTHVLAVLERARAHRDGDVVFWSVRKRGAPLSTGVFPWLLRSAGVKADTHGFRTSFRTWCVANQVQDPVAEACLAHSLGPPTVESYLRAEMLLRERAQAMQGWGDYLSSSLSPSLRIAS